MRPRHHADHPLARRLREADQLGQPAGPLLRRAANRRELGTAESVAQVLCWRLGAVLDALAEQPLPPTVDRAVPWLRPIPQGVVGSAWSEYLERSEALIRSRIDELASAAIADRPEWLGAIGAESEEAAQRASWRRALEAAAAFRDEYGVETDDAAHPLGPHLEAGRAGHTEQVFTGRLIAAASRPVGDERHAQPMLNPPLSRRQTRKQGDPSEPRRRSQQPVARPRQNGPVEPSPTRPKTPGIGP